MAVISFEAETNMKPIADLARAFPNLTGKFLGYVGKDARRRLKQDYLSGQEINLKAYPKDSRGRYTIVNDVNKKKNELKIYSYPLMLFEKGRRLRNGKKESGKYILTRKLKQDISSDMSSYVRIFEDSILKGKLEDLGL